MRPEDYRLVFLSSDSSCREDTEDSSSTSSAAPPLTDDCDWDYFEPGASASSNSTVLPSIKRTPTTCPRTCSCGAEPRFVAVPVPVPVPVPAALWPTLLYPAQTPPTPHWNTYPGFPPLDATALAQLTTAAAVAVSAAAASATSTQLKLPEMITVDTTDKAVQSETAQGPALSDNDKSVAVIDRPVECNVSEQVNASSSFAEVSILERLDFEPQHLESEKAFHSSNESAASSDCDAVNVQGSYDLVSGNPEEPPTSDEDSDDSGGGGGQFSRVFVVNSVDSSSESEVDNDSSGIDCDDSYAKKTDNFALYPSDNDDRNERKSEISANLNMIDHAKSYKQTPDCLENTLVKDKNVIQSEVYDNLNSLNSDSGTGTYCSLNGQTENSYTPENTSEISTDSNSLNSVNKTVNLYNIIHLENNHSLNKNLHTTSNVSNIENKLIFSDSVHKENESLKRNESSCQNNDESITQPKTVSHDEKIDLFKGIERKLGELLKKELLDERETEKTRNARPVCGNKVGCASAPAVTTVCHSPTGREDGAARFTSRVMITDDRVSVVTSNTTQLTRDISVHHTHLQNESQSNNIVEQIKPDGQLLKDNVLPQSSGVTVVSNSDTLSAVVCLEEGLADDDSWVENVSHDEDDNTTTSDSDSSAEMSLDDAKNRSEDFQYCRPSLDFTLHTIIEESCEESEAEYGLKKQRPLSATELEKYFFFGLCEGKSFDEQHDQASESSSVCSEGGESIVDNEIPENTEENLASSRLEKYFLSGFMGFSQERRDSDESGSVGSDSEGKQSPEQRRKRLVRARGTPRSHSNSLDNLLTGEELPSETKDVSDGSSTEIDERHDSLDRLDNYPESKRKKQNKKVRCSPSDEKRLSTEFKEDNRDDNRSVSEGEDSRSITGPEFLPLGSDLSESKKQTSRDSGFVGSCDDLLKNGESSSEYFRSLENKVELEEIIEESRPDVEDKLEDHTTKTTSNILTRKDSFTNWSSDEETNLMMTKMRQFFKQMINSNNTRTNHSTPITNENARPPKLPQLLYFESELTRLMKTVPGIRDEEVREIVEYLSSEETWSDSYDSSDYAGSDLEGGAANRSALRRQISESCREIIDEFDRGNTDGNSLEHDAAGAYRRLAATLGRAGEGSPPLFGKVIRHIGGRLVALMHEVSAGATASAEEDSTSEPGALARSKSHDVLEAAASRGSVASDSERFSWRGSFESALLASDSRGTLGGVADARQSPAGADLTSLRSQSRSCGAISGSEDRLWRGKRRASAPDAEVEEEQRAGSLPRLGAGGSGGVRSARYRAPGFRGAARAASAPGLHPPRRRRVVPTAHLHTSASVLQDDDCGPERAGGAATLPRRANSPLPHDRDRLANNARGRTGLQTRSESLASVYSGAGEGGRGAVAVRGEVHFSLLYNYRAGALEVGVRRCRDLAPVDTKKNRSDPYVKVYLLPDKSKSGKRKTKVKKNTLNPVFEETLGFVQPLASLGSRTLWLSVWHADTFGRNDFLGEVLLPLAGLVFDDPAPVWYPLRERTEQFDESQQGTRGDLIIGLKFEPQEGVAARGKGTLHVLVKEAKNLVATKSSGLCDVFCKSYLLPERGRLTKQKTGVARRTLSPQWEHTFTYKGVTAQELEERALELSLWDRDRLASNDFMGAVRLSLGTGTYMGSSVNWMDSTGKEVTLWQTMLERPNFWVEGSLPLRPQLNN